MPQHRTATHLDLAAECSSLPGTRPWRCCRWPAACSSAALTGGPRLSSMWAVSKATAGCRHWHLARAPHDPCPPSPLRTLVMVVRWVATVVWQVAARAGFKLRDLLSALPNTRASAGARLLTAQHGRGTPQHRRGKQQESSAVPQPTQIGECRLCVCLRLGQVGLCRGQLHSGGVRRSPQLRQLGLDGGVLSRLPL